MNSGGAHPISILGWITFITLFSGLFVRAEAPAPNQHPVYRQLRDIQLSGQKIVVENLTLQRESARITFTAGEIYFLPPVEGRVTGAVFLGQGTLAITPSIASEQRHLSILTRAENLEDSFQKMVLRFTDDTFEELTRTHPSSPSTAPAEAVNHLSRIRNKIREGNPATRGLAAAYLRSNIDGRIALDLFRSEGKGFFHLFVHGDRYGDMIFQIDPLGSPFVAPEEVVLVSLETSTLGIWMASHLRDHYLRGDPADEQPALIDIEHQEIAATAEKERLEAQVTTHFTARGEGVKVLPFDLFPQLRVTSVHDWEDRPLHFVQEEKEKDADLFVFLQETLEKDRRYRLHFVYSGKEALSDSGGGNYTLVARTNWYPSTSFGDRATFDLRLKVPKDLEVVATGHLIAEKKEGKFLNTHWKSEIPLSVAGFNFGKFKRETTRDKEIDYTIETYANLFLPDYLRSIQHQIEAVEQATGRRGLTTLGSLSTTGIMEKARAEAQASIRLFSNHFGPLPYGRIAMTQQPYPNFGQAWPMLVYMPLTAFLDSTHRHQLLNDFDSSFFRYVAAHEVAHQWWGHVIGWKSYRDQWMSEGFAEFSASLFAQAVYGNEKFRDFWKEERELILGKNVKGARPVDIGSLHMGYRLDTARTGSVTRAVIYPKGAFVLHMLRMMMWSPQEGDSAFVAMMSDFVKTHHNQQVSTEDFQRSAEKHMTDQMALEGNGDLSWFFRQWVYGTDVPRYAIEYRLDDAGGDKTRLLATVSQSEVTDSFKMLVPVYVRFGDNEPQRLGALTLIGNTSYEFEVLLPQRPTAVLLNWFEDVLALP